MLTFYPKTSLNTHMDPISRYCRRQGRISYVNNQAAQNEHSLTSPLRIPRRAPRPLARTPRTMPSGSDDSRSLCLVPRLGGRHPVFQHGVSRYTKGFVAAFYQIGDVPSVTVPESFYPEGVLAFISVFCSYWDKHTLFSLFNDYGAIYWFSNIKPTLRSQDEARLATRYSAVAQLGSADRHLGKDLILRVPQT